jgi:conjugative relaxase-like TrwC/TraI family protein
MVVYRNSPAAARACLEADRGRVDDYYLREETALAQRFSASPTTGVDHLGSLSGDGYEAWVAGVDPDTGIPKGNLRSSGNAVRFVEVTVNGPKSWSIAAAIHPDISVAYDKAQDRAAEQIIGWLAQHATTRIGPRGGQVQVPVTEIEAVTVRHYTSRAGDPHRHLHLQVNARVQAEGKWYGLHTVGVRDSLDAINGIGHAAMMTDPAFRTALASHGYTLDPRTGEIAQMSEYVGAFSTRTRQIETNLDRYEAAWRRANPGQEPGPVLRQRWDHRAWNDARPGKIVPKSGEEITAAWLGELHALGYRDPAGPVLDLAVRPGEMNRGEAVEAVLARLGARRSAWNAADVRGEVEQHLARAGIVTDAAVRLEIAEDLTARALAGCVPLLDRPGLPEHLRALTSPHVLAVEADLVSRLAARAVTEPVTVAVSPQVTAGLDAAQRQVAAALAGDGRLLVVEGAAGAGKTTTLAAARTSSRKAVIGLSWSPQPGRLRRSPPHSSARPRSPPRGSRISTAGAGTSTEPGPAWGSGRWTRAGTAGRVPTSDPPPKADYGRETCCWWMRPGCSTRTPPTPCWPLRTKRARGSRSSATGTNSRPSAGAECSIWPPDTPRPRRGWS